MFIDLQLHSTYSDGYLTPSALATLLRKNDIKVASLADHNTVGGLKEFQIACQKHRIKAIPGLELYVRNNNQKFNLLWYNFDSNSPALHNLLRLSQMRRRRQIRNALVKLRRLGLKIDQEKLLDKFNHYIPLNHLIDQISCLSGNKRLLASRLKIANPRQEENIQYLFKNPAFAKVSESYISLGQILKLRQQIGGQLILNHPGKHNQLDRKLIWQLKKLGLDGLEILSPHHSIGAVMYAQSLAKEFNLIMSSGSDFHRLEPGTGSIKSCFDYYKVDSKYLSGINKIIG